MTVKLIAIYNTPEDPEAFDAHYENVHLPLARQIPNLLSLEVLRVNKAIVGGRDVYLIAELIFADQAAFDAAAASEEFGAAGADVMSFAGGKVSLLQVIG